MAKTRLGFQDDKELLTDGPKREFLLEAMRRAGGKRVRANVIYSQFDKDPEKYDRLVDAAKRHGLKVQMTLMGDPTYGDKSSKLSATRPDAKLMGQFALRAAARYKGKVDRYSVWNEANHPYFLATKHAARDYRHLYQNGYKAIKAVDPHAQVLLGELAPTGGKGKEALPFLRRVVRGHHLKTDGVAFHPYQDGDPSKKPTNGKLGTIGNLGRMNHVLGSLQKKHQLQGGRNHMYLTEFGYQTTDGSEASRLRHMAGAMRQANKHGARELVQYQVTPKDKQQYADPFTRSWDTSLAPARLATALRKTKRPSRGA